MTRIVRLFSDKITSCLRRAAESMMYSPDCLHTGIEGNQTPRTVVAAAFTVGCTTGRQRLALDRSGPLSCYRRRRDAAAAAAAAASGQS